MGKGKKRLSSGNVKESESESEGEEVKTNNNSNNNEGGISKKQRKRDRVLRKKIKKLEVVKDKERSLPVKKVFWVDKEHLNWNEQEVQELKLKRKSLGIKVLDLDTTGKLHGVPAPVTSLRDQKLPQHFRAYFEHLPKKISTPTPIQSQCWPAILNGRDVVALAPTGSGKTLAYIAPMIPHILAIPRTGRGPIALVLVPTRELVLQIENWCRPLETLYNIRTVAIYGGSDKEEQIGKWKDGCEIMVATTGRLADILAKKEDGLPLSCVTILVLDEADRMLNMGFIDQLDKVCSEIRKDRQILMFSATFPKNVQEATNRWMKSPVKIRVGEKEEAGTISNTITQVVEVCTEEEKLSKVTAFFDELDERERGERHRERVIIFVNEVKTIDKLFRLLKQRPNNFKIWKGKKYYRVVTLYGALKQKEREDAMEGFKSSRYIILITTDLAARGIDVTGLKYVVNFDFPLSIDHYIHRVGRTGRQGKIGAAYTLFTPNSNSVLHAPKLVALFTRNQSKY